MRLSLTVILLALVAVPTSAATPEQKAVAERFVSALAGEGGFLADDFVQPLTEQDNAVFARYQRCKAHEINSIAANRDDAANANRVMVRFSCKGTPDRYPIYVSLYFQDSKIAAVETHNADLLLAEVG